MKNFVDQALDYLIDPNLNKVLKDLKLGNEEKIIAGAMFKGCNIAFKFIDAFKYEKEGKGRIVAYKAIDISFINQIIVCIRYEKQADGEYKEMYRTNLTLWMWEQLSYEEPQEDNVEQ